MLQAEKKGQFYLHHVLKVKSVLLEKRPHYRYQEKERGGGGKEQKMKHVALKSQKPIQS